MGHYRHGHPPPTANRANRAVEAENYPCPSFSAIFYRIKRQKDCEGLGLKAPRNLNGIFRGSSSTKNGMKSCTWYCGSMWTSRDRERVSTEEPGHSRITNDEQHDGSYQSHPRLQVASGQFLEDGHIGYGPESNSVPFPSSCIRDWYKPGSGAVYDRRHTKIVWSPPGWGGLIE